MRRTGVCPKCGSHNIVVPGHKIHRGVEILSTGTLSVTILQRYVCTDCGYAELWVEDPVALAELAAKYGKKDI